MVENSTSDPVYLQGVLPIQVKVSQVIIHKADEPDKLVNLLDTHIMPSHAMALYEVTDRTIERYLASHGGELSSNGYRLLKGKKLKDFKELTKGTDIDVGTITSVLGVFSFRAVLNIGMLLTESEPARLLRSRLLDIVLDVMAERAGGHTKFINQRDENYLPSALQEENYRRQFTDALDSYVEGNHWKYARFTNLIYQSIFHEHIKSRKRIFNRYQKPTLNVFSERKVAPWKSN